ncbi:SPT2 chromatin protein-domain-containing protein [Absidia repens]|uniref:SPT2 chromatin protein-domain-containing protein n=1 Tax=Absidia repens TaxID=90262 RepID=A0A1X2I4E4_9FUNG|nr:SPT2 chromatin protein-domain-containing protein [Absidia repens]
MLKSNSKDITFEQLMKQAAEVAKAQDAVLSEKTKERRRLEDERQRKEEHALMEKQRKEEELHAKHQAMEQRHRQLLEKKQHHTNTQSSRKTPSSPSTMSQHQRQKQQDPQRRSVPTKPMKSKKVPAASSLAIFEKKKPVHMSYEQLMEKAKEVSSPKKPSVPARKVGNVSSSSTLDNRQTKDLHGPSKNLPSSTTSTASPLYLKRSNLASTKSKAQESLQSMRARDRIRLEFNTPAQKMARTKRDRQSIEEIQRDIRHSKGKYSDDDDSADIRPKQRHRPDHTRLHASSRNPTRTAPPTLSRQQQQLPSSIGETRKQQRPLATPSQHQQRAPIRMPFRRAMDPKRPPRRPHRPDLDAYDDEDDDDLDSFIVDDDDRYDRSRADENDYSSEISKIFRYDRRRFANESVYSDDDMEANSMDVLREEKRSERLARREDQLEDQLEQERRKKRLAKSKGK